MSQLYLADKLIASTEGSDIKYNEEQSVNEKLDELSDSLNEFKRQLTAADDLNEITEPGLYYYMNSSGVPKNAPFSYATVIEVVCCNPSNNRIIQMATRYDRKGQSAIRTIYDSNWNDWMYPVYSDSPFHLPFHLGIDASGNYGYIEVGADTVTPFKKGYEDTPGTATAATIIEGKTAWVNGKKITGTAKAAATYLTGTKTGTLPMNNSVSVTINFEPAFSAKPSSFTYACVYTSGVSNGADVYADYTVTSLTASAAVLKITHKSGTTPTYKLTWTAQA